MRDSLINLVAMLSVISLIVAAVIWIGILVGLALKAWLWAVEQIIIALKLRTEFVQFMFDKRKPKVVSPRIEEAFADGSQIPRKED